MSHEEGHSGPQDHQAVHEVRNQKLDSLATQVSCDGRNCLITISPIFYYFGDFIKIRKFYTVLFYFPPNVHF
jgi:hypothetical protein